MKIALIYPPICDPTAPYISIPALASYLKRNGVEVIPIDANIDACNRLLTCQSLSDFADLIETRFNALNTKKRLGHIEQLAYIELWESLKYLQTIPFEIENAIKTFRDPELFFDINSYDKAVTTVERAFELINAAYTPLTMNFTAYRTPFSLLTMDDIKADSQKQRNPFYDYYANHLTPLLKSRQIKIVGVSVAFPSQIQQAYSLAYVLRQQMPDLHILAGGPAMTQILLRQTEKKREKILGDFDCAVLFEGEQALLKLIEDIQQGIPIAKIIYGNRHTDLNSLESPDYDNMPLSEYLSPEPVLSYDPARGCYWGKCAFCHYGLTETGTAKYRERNTDRIVQDLNALSQKYKNRIFYFSQDTLSPKTALELALKIKATGLKIRWAGDMRPEPSLSLETCRTFFESGALSIALGVESVSPEILNLINKGIELKHIKNSIRNLDDAKIAVEVMCFTDFPTETFKEAVSTLDFLEKHRKQIALFMCGKFGLSYGSQVAVSPQKYGIREVWNIQGDEFLSGLFYELETPSINDHERDKIDKSLKRLSKQWIFRHYPWAGSLSTAHTLLWYNRFGTDIFKQLSDKTLWKNSTNNANSANNANVKTKTKRKPISPSFNVEKMIDSCQKIESKVWETMIYKNRRVTQKDYLKLIEIEK